MKPLYATRNESDSQLFSAMRLWYGKPSKYQGIWFAEGDCMPAGYMTPMLFRCLCPGVRLRKGRCVEIKMKEAK